jgi:hypothetical protein
LHENFMTKNILKTNISKHRRLKRVLIMKRVLNKKLWKLKGGTNEGWVGEIALYIRETSDKGKPLLCGTS